MQRPGAKNIEKCAPGQCSPTNVTSSFIFGEINGNFLDSSTSILVAGFLRERIHGWGSTTLRRSQRRPSMKGPTNRGTVPSLWLEGIGASRFAMLHPLQKCRCAAGLGSQQLNDVSFDPACRAASGTAKGTLEAVFFSCEVVQRLRYSSTLLHP